MSLDDGTKCTRSDTEFRTRIGQRSLVTAHLRQLTSTSLMGRHSWRMQSPRLPFLERSRPKTRC